MFLLNEGYQWQSAHFSDSLHGIVYLPAHNHAERLARRSLGEFSWKLIDPQLYLAGLDCTECSAVCARLATFPWFGINGLPEYFSGEGSLRDWEREVKDAIADLWPHKPPEGKRIMLAARAAVAYQADRCSHILLPTPLICDRENEGTEAAEWIDAGLAAADALDVGPPVLATVALSEGVLNDAAFKPGAFLDTIVDQVTSRDGLRGVYIVVAQTESRHPFSTNTAVIKAYAHLTRAFSKFNYEFIIANYADTFGVGCIGLGATGFATGPRQSLRRLSLAAFREGGGVSYPRFYSHQSIGEFLPERELPVIARNKLLSSVRDETVHSRDLMRQLERSGPFQNVPSWAEHRGNVTASLKHFITRMILEGHAYVKRDDDERVNAAREWLEHAVKAQATIRKKMGDDLKFAPAAEWLKTYQAASE